MKEGEGARPTNLPPQEPQMGPSLGRGWACLSLGMATRGQWRVWANGGSRPRPSGQGGFSEEKVGALTEQVRERRQSDSYHEARWVGIHVSWMRPVGSCERIRDQGTGGPLALTSWLIERVLCSPILYL